MFKKTESDENWSELWNVFIPKNCSKTLAEMNDYERLIRNDRHTTALKEFSE